MLKEDIQVDNKHVKEHSASLVFREMQIIAAVGYQCPLLGMTKLKTNRSDVGEDVEQAGLSHFPGGNVKWCSHFGKDLSGRVL